MSSTSTDSVSLPDTLRGLSDDQLAELLRLRPDLLTPLPSDTEQLAGRATSRASVARVLDRLDRHQLAVIEATEVAHAPVSVDDIRGLLPEVDVGTVLKSLRELALVWGSDESLHVSDVIGQLLGPYPAGLGPPAPKELDTQEFDKLLDDAGPEARALATRLAAGPPIAVSGDGRSLNAVVAAMVQRSLLLRVDLSTVALPRQLGLHLRGGVLFPADSLIAPSLPGTSRDQDLIDRTAAGTALELIRRVEQVLEEWGQSAPAVLKIGGLGVRDLRKVAARLDVDEHLAALYVEIAYAAGLLGRNDQVPPGWQPTDGYDKWLALEPAARWEMLTSAWLDSPRSAGLVGTRDEKDKTRTALSMDVSRSSAPEFRRLALATLPAGVAITPEDVIAWVRWQRPRRTSRSAEDFIRFTLIEAAALGVTGLGGPASPGRALLDASAWTEGSPGSGASSAAGSSGSVGPAAAVLAPLLPTPVDYVLLQADLTAVAPGPLQPDLARALALMADAESHGGATVYRFSPDSMRRALDTGRTAAELHSLLAEHSRTPVPQPLTYLVDDVARKHGHLRSGTAAAYLRCDDETQLKAIVADKRTADLGLRQIAPTVIVSRIPVRSLIEELRTLGYSPVPEGTDGSLVPTKKRAGRAVEAMPRNPFQNATRAPEPTLLAAAVRAMRTGDRVRSAKPGAAETTVFRVGRTASVDAIRVLRGAAEQGWTVWIGYADQHGTTSDRVIDPIRVDGGVLTAYDHAAAANRTFLLHRVTGVARVE